MPEIKPVDLRAKTVEVLRAHRYNGVRGCVCGRWERDGGTDLVAAKNAHDEHLADELGRIKVFEVVAP